MYNFALTSFQFYLFFSELSFVFRATQNTWVLQILQTPTWQIHFQLQGDPPPILPSFYHPVVSFPPPTYPHPLGKGKTINIWISYLYFRRQFHPGIVYLSLEVIYVVLVLKYLNFMVHLKIRGKNVKYPNRTARSVKCYVVHKSLLQTASWRPWRWKCFGLNREGW